jgi:hypothetical protein
MTTKGVLICRRGQGFCCRLRTCLLRCKPTDTDFQHMCVVGRPVLGGLQREYRREEQVA